LANILSVLLKSVVPGKGKLSVTVQTPFQIFVDKSSCSVNFAIEINIHEENPAVGLTGTATKLQRSYEETFVHQLFSYSF
jgi:hypothetical protein